MYQRSIEHPWVASEVVFDVYSFGRQLGEIRIESNGDDDLDYGCAFDEAVCHWGTVSIELVQRVAA